MEYKRDFEELLPYYEAFWNCEVLDRVAVAVTAPITGCPAPKFQWHKPCFVVSEPVERILEEFEQEVGCFYYGGLSVPQYWPNFGPDAFSGFLGAKMNYSGDSDSTSWADWHSCVLKDYKDVSQLRISDENPLYRKNLELTRLSAQRGKGRYLVGNTDIHAGFDALAVLRGGPDRASIDLIENPEGVKEAMQVLFKAWQKVWDDYYNIVKDIQPGTTSWIGIWAPGKMHPVQNDFSCLVSPSMYREFFLEELIAEIEYLEASEFEKFRCGLGGCRCDEQRAPFGTPAETVRRVTDERSEEKRGKQSGFPSGMTGSDSDRQRGVSPYESNPDRDYRGYSIYHLDGPQALQHLDILLDIPKLNAIQWVSGARADKESISRYLPLYKKIQEKKKSIVVYPKIEEVDIVLENLKPEGLLISLGCTSEEQAKEVMKKLGWRN